MAGRRMPRYTVADYLGVAAPAPSWCRALLAEAVRVHARARPRRRLNEVVRVRFRDPEGVVRDFSAAMQEPVPGEDGPVLSVCFHCNGVAQSLPGVPDVLDGDEFDPEVLLAFWPRSAIADELRAWFAAEIAAGRVDPTGRGLHPSLVDALGLAHQSPRRGGRPR